MVGAETEGVATADGPFIRHSDEGPTIVKCVQCSECSSGPWPGCVGGGEETRLPRLPSMIKVKLPSLPAWTSVLCVVLFVMLPTAEAVINTGNPDAKRLYDDLLSNYNKLVRPVQNTTDPLTVRIKLKLSQLIDVVSKMYSVNTH